MEGPRVDPIVELAQGDARRDAGLNLNWIAYGAGCWMFAVVHASVNNPTVPSDRLLGKSPKYVNAYTNEYKRSVKKPTDGDVSNRLGRIAGGNVLALEHLYRLSSSVATSATLF